MSAFVEKSFCRGVVPAGIPAFNYERREQLLKMMGTNESVRVLNAPSGYGKSALSASYVNSTLGFKNTVWLDCASSNFIRDLNNSELIKTLKTRLDGLKLCVFDELPHMTDKLIKEFIILINFLISKSINVVINTSPEAKNAFLNDNFNFCLEPKDLLCERDNPTSVPAFVFSKGKQTTIFDSLKFYGLSQSEMLVYYCMMAMGNGKFKDLEMFITRRHLNKDIKFLAHAFPHLGIDLDNCVFATIDVDVVDLKEGFSFAIDEVIEFSKMKRKVNFYECLTDVLKRYGNFSRAANLAKTNLKVPERLRWAIINTQSFSDSNNSNEIIDCLTTTSQQMGENRDEVNGCLCHALYCLGDYEQANSCARRILRSRKAKAHTKLYACEVALLTCENSDAYDFADLMLEISSSEKQDAFSDLPFSSFKFKEQDLKFLHDFLITWYDDSLKGLVILMDKVEECNATDGYHNLRDIICVCASFVFRKLTQDVQDCFLITSAIKVIFYGAEDLNYVYDLIGCLIKFCFDSAKDENDASVNNFEVMQASDEALKVCESLCADYLKFGDSSLFQNVRIHRFKKQEDYSLFNNRNTRNYEVLSVKSNKVYPEQSGKVKFSFFGGLSFEVDGVCVQTNLNRRQNCLYFLYLLSRDLGRELTRDSVIDEVWNGNASSDANKRNYYNALLTLKMSFSKAVDNEIIKTNNAGIFLDPEACSSDLQEFEDFCNMINFDFDSASKDMMSVASKLRRFSRPILPQITKFSSFNTIRLSYTEKLIDALIFASMGLLERQDFKNALWYAKQAKAIDRKREDIYYLIMKAQNALNLRSSAIMTFFECKKVLSDEFGMTPSEDIKELYQLVIS